MKNLFTLLACAVSFSAFAQFDAQMAPFHHGVASGDALSDAVIIWTRVTPENNSDTYTVNWEMATDETFSSIMANGSYQTDSTSDFTVKVDVTGLAAATWYYYRFELEGDFSLTGRTRTMPVQQVNRMRFAVASCSNFGGGLYYNAYADMAQQDSIDAVIHLGDYIYEGGGSTSGNGIQVQPPNEIISLDDYRQRYASYRLDSNLREVHRKWPFYTVWDDHESANNSWADGAQAHDPNSEGPWEERLANAQQAYFEWLPIRPKQPGSYSIYRKIPMGPLVDLIMIDTRIEGRDQEVGATDPAIDDPNRTILGEQQMQWLKDQLSSSTAQWKIIGNQVMFAPLELPAIPFIFPEGGIVNADQWDGYRADREELIEHLDDNGIDNSIVITGDIHTSWGNDIPHHDQSYDPDNGQGSVGVEFVVTSITSGSSPVNVGAELISVANPHMKYIDLSQKGYLILEVNQEYAKGQWVYVSSVNEANYTVSTSETWVTLSGQNFLRPESALGVEDRAAGPRTFSVEVFPNPTGANINVKLRSERSAVLSYTLHDASGRIIRSAALGNVPSGTSEHAIDLNGFASGLYMVRVTDEQGERASELFVKK